MAVPEPGQLVEVRRRQWVVTDVQSSGLPDVAQHLIGLASLDEDALGEVPTAVWELEPGARVLETAGLPEMDGWDDCERLEAFLDAVRWGAVAHADRTLLQAPFRSGIEIKDFQLDPLVRAIDMARANLLIADDVGLGKTIEAGLVIQELLVRHRARSVLVVCPASLQIKWQTEMHERFGLEFRIVDTEYIRQLRRSRGLHANPWTSFPRLIASVDWMKSGEALRLLKDALPNHATYPRKFDILVVDEAHNVAPAAAGYYALPSQRTQLIRTLSPHFEHHLFLTATPHNGYQESFTALLELLDDQRFARGVLPDERQLRRVMVRRLKTDLVDEHGERIYPARELEALNVRYTDEEYAVHGLLREYTESRTVSVQGTRAGFGAEFVHKLLKKRLFSSPRAFAMTLAKHRDTLSRRSQGGSRVDTKGSMRERILKKAILRAEEEYADDRQVEEAQEEAVDVATELAAQVTDEQRKMLDRLSSWAERNKNRADSKAEAILDWLEEHLRAGGDWNDERVILFTEYRATHSWLLEIIASRGWGGERVMTLHGGTDPDEREHVKAAFQAHPNESPVRILLATDAASEGIDLQNHCHYLIHVEIPWNPNVMEQRNGRIDRHGQKAKVVRIWHPVGIKAAGSPSGDMDGDHEFLFRAVRKVESIRQDLGSVGPVIARQIEEAMLGRRDAMDTREAEATAESTRRLVAAERRLEERIARLHTTLLEARETLHVTPERVQRAVSVALALAERPPLKPVALSGAPEGSVFHVPSLVGSWARAAEGLEHPYSGTRRPITFDHNIVEGRDDVVLAHLEHRFVRMALRLLRAEIWAPEDRKLLRRVAVRTVPDGMLRDPAAMVWSRLVVTGGGHHRLHEELTFAGGELRKGSFARFTTLRQQEELIAASTPHKPSGGLFELLKERFEVRRDALLGAVERRSNERVNGLTSALASRQKADQDDLSAVLDDLDAMIRRELDAAARPEQLELWPADQQEQLRRDSEMLRARLERIPEEREREVAALGVRYANPVHRTFPVAVEFLVPESIAKEA